jgi:dihydrodipicolinate synthase/N-acetylneuraminate lyase
VNVDDILKRVQPRRAVSGIAAALLPFEADGRIAVDCFQQRLRATHEAGLINAVNMDTGYVNYLSDEERQDVLAWTREALGYLTPFVAGAYIESTEDGVAGVAALYRREMDLVAEIGGTPILFPTARLRGLGAREKAAVYRDACRGFSAALAFELSPVFAPNGELFDDEMFRRLMDIPELKGMKHSSLDRLMELERLELRDTHRPEFRVYTGNDLGIDMIEYGSDYLLGLAAFAPEKFAERDRLWRDGDSRYYALNDALQHLGNVAFRPPVPAYKHSAAVFLHLCGRIPSSCTHPKNSQRPDWEASILRDCAVRLGYL